MGITKTVLENPLRHFYPSFNACNLVQFQKNLMNTFRKEFRNADLGPKMTLYHNFSIRIFLKKWSMSILYVHSTLTSCKKSEKYYETNPRTWCYRRVYIRRAYICAFRQRELNSIRPIRLSPFFNSYELMTFLFLVYSVINSFLFLSCAFILPRFFEIFQLRTKFQTAMVPFSRIIT